MPRHRRNSVDTEAETQELSEGTLEELVEEEGVNDEPVEKAEVEAEKTPEAETVFITPSFSKHSPAAVRVVRSKNTLKFVR